MWRVLVIALVITALIGCQAICFAADIGWTVEQKLYKQIKPAVVHINSYYYQRWYIGNLPAITTIVGGRGSGSFISPDGYIVTNAHVVECAAHDKQTRQNYLKEKLVETLVYKSGWTREAIVNFLNQAIQRQLVRVSDITIINTVVTPGGEELAFELKEIGNPIGEKEGKDVAIIKVEGRNFPTARINATANVRPSDHIFIGGYPAGGDLQSLGSEKSQLEMTWSEGTIASEKKASAQGAPLLQVNASGVTVGNSGGPVFNTEGQMIGILTFFMKAGGDRGSMYCMASSTIMEFVRKSGANTEESATDKAYHSGLEFYFQGYYSKALPKFEEAKRLYPKLAGIDDLITECQTNIAQGNDKRYWPDLYPYLGVAFVLIVGGIILVLIKRRNKLKDNKIETDSKSNN